MVSSLGKDLKAFGKAPDWFPYIDHEVCKSELGYCCPGRMEAKTDLISPLNEQQEKSLLHTAPGWLSFVVGFVVAFFAWVSLFSVYKLPEVGLVYAGF